MKVGEFWKQVLLNGLFFFTCNRSVLVEVTELNVVHASVHIVYTRTFGSLLWINTSGELSTGCPTKQLAVTGTAGRYGLSFL